MTERLAGWIEASCAYSLTLSPEDIADGIDSGDYAVFTGEYSVLIAQIEEYPRKGTKICDVVVAGGQLEELNTVLRPRVENWARENNCTHCMVEGRPGWRRATRPHGYVEHLTNVVKEL